MIQTKKEIICAIILVSLLSSVYALVTPSVTYQVLSTDPNETRAAIRITNQRLFWTLVLRFDNTVKLRVTTGGTVTSSSPKGNIYIITGPPVQSGQTHDLIFESKYDKKKTAKLIGASFNGKSVKLI